ncbi:zinc-ribbon domain and TM2 domain-containing protein [Thalassospira marina]|uniref:TM2 domain-containing protein n=1 Tax=Thalassospira marina TaxID=2048283 RepID=A0ABM6Q781_9PROT|nr:TM2 domain-containing protein [Thalassospira marina]AUG51812.1 hypothetical protein CSC3H3_03100 [Thalassospira marina]
MIYCTSCGTEISEAAIACPKCGQPNAAAGEPGSPKGFVPTLLLCLFLGVFGIHRFYVGKIITGILMILTFGGFGIWSFIDLIMIIVGSFRDKNGLRVKR